jgi:hypothetical protein
MITVTQSVEKIINRSRYLSEAISKGLINTSSLARYIRPEVETMLLKEVSDASILMAINRLSKQLKPKYSSHAILQQTPPMILHGQLSLFVYKKSKNLGEILKKLVEIEPTNQSFFLFSMQNSLLVVCSKDLLEKTEKLFHDIPPLKTAKTISAITIFLPKDVLNTPGIYYFFLKSLAWEGVNIIEIISVEDEVTLVLEDKDAQNAYTILQSLFSK